MLLQKDRFSGFVNLTDFASVIKNLEWKGWESWKFCDGIKITNVLQVVNLRELLPVSPSNLITNLKSIVVYCIGPDNLNIKMWPLRAPKAGHILKRIKIGHQILTYILQAWKL